MKKKVICIIIFSVFIMHSKSVVINAEIDSKLSSNNLYVSAVKYIDHDDYFDYVKEKTKLCNCEQQDFKDKSSQEINIDSKMNIKEEKDDEKKDDTDSNNLMLENIESGSVEQEIIEKDDVEIKISEEINNSSKDDINMQELSSEENGKYYAVNGSILDDNKLKVIDVSHHQGKINWDEFKNNSNFYGVILRIGYKTTMDKKFVYNISELKRLNIPYGIYLFSYALNSNDAKLEANFTNKIIDDYNLTPTLGIYYDLESWKTKSSSSDSITKNGYNYIAKKYVEEVKEHVNEKYKVGVYSGRWYAMNRLGRLAKSYVLWVAEYNKTLKYDGYYTMWQYTSKGSVSGINGSVDISYLYIDKHN